MTRRLPLAAALFLALLQFMALAATGQALAHFGMVLPEVNEVSAPGPVTIRYLFWHPMEGEGMDLAKPRAEVRVGGKTTDLTGTLKDVAKDGHTTWSASYTVAGPGCHVFTMSPQPYWEAAEDRFIVHYTKTIVSALGVEEGWTAPIGMKLEIVPLSKPFGIWAGTSFTGKVLFKGKPLADADVEIEYYNQDGKVQVPSGAYLSQVVRTNGLGTFTATIPWAGWWGFAALTDDDAPLKHEGKPKKVELGGVLWLYAHEAPGK